MKHLIRDVKQMWNIIHDYGIVESGEFPTREQTLKAAREGRIDIADHETNGHLHIKGENACEIYWEI